MNSEDYITSQIDIELIKPLKLGHDCSVYKIKRHQEGETKNQMVNVLPDIRNHYALRREKDLLRYLNQFSDDFPRFNEIRKVNFSYLQFFDYVGKTSLKAQVKKEAVLGEAQAKILLQNMVSTLKHLHAVGFVHADICPENIVFYKERYHLINWQKSMPSISSFETEIMSGDQRYCPPERLNGQYGDSGDIYTLGCTLYFAMTGKHIYRLTKVENVFDQLYAHANHAMRKPGNLPIFWRQLIQWMTQKDPYERPTIAELEQWLQDQSVPKNIRQQEIVPKKHFPEDSLTALADQHYLYALFKKAVIFEASGDLESAFNLYENCAFQGYTRAENNIGLLYEKGQPVKQSNVKALNMYHQAFKKHNPYAAYNLAHMFEQGLGVEANAEQAFKLYKYAALRGNVSAQNKLGELYSSGVGAGKDPVQARFWFGMSAHYGNHDAVLNIQRYFQHSQINCA